MRSDGIEHDNAPVVTLRCPKVWELNRRRERCVKADGHEGECQVNVWLAIKCPALEPGIGTSVEASIQVRRVE
jgi:hypothetical protein